MANVTMSSGQSGSGPEGMRGDFWDIQTQPFWRCQAKGSTWFSHPLIQEGTCLRDWLLLAAACPDRPIFQLKVIFNIPYANQ